jgi:hypothetical protein
MGGACSTTGKRRGVYRMLVGKPQRKSPFERSQRRREYKIKMNLQDVGWGHGLD